MSLEVAGRLSTSDTGYFLGLTNVLSSVASVSGRVITTAIEYSALSSIIIGVSTAVINAKMARKEWSLTSDDFSPKRFAAHVVIGSFGAGVAVLGTTNLLGIRLLPVAAVVNDSDTNTAEIPVFVNGTKTFRNISIQDVTIPYAPGFNVTAASLPVETQHITTVFVPEVTQKVASVFDSSTMCELPKVTLPAVDVGACSTSAEPQFFESLIKQTGGTRTVDVPPEAAETGWFNWIWPANRPREA